MAPADCHWLVRILARWKEACPLSFLRPPFKRFRCFFRERNGAPREASLSLGNENETWMDIFFPDGIDLVRTHTCLEYHYRDVFEEFG
jgi:hypothetical protein